MSLSRDGKLMGIETFTVPHVKEVSSLLLSHMNNLAKAQREKRGTLSESGDVVRKWRYGQKAGLV